MLYLYLSGRPIPEVYLFINTILYFHLGDSGCHYALEDHCSTEDKYQARLLYETVGLFPPPRVQVEEVEVNITDQGN